MTKDNPVRKPLRQRVADRKRGIKPERPMSEQTKQWLKFSRIVCIAMQYIGLFMLLFSVGDIVSSGYNIENPALIVIYCMMFLVGRIGIMVLKWNNIFR